jgi:SIR2-like domain
MIIPLQEALEPLANLLREGRLIIFVGAGISLASDLPTWDGFLDKFIDFCNDLKNRYPNNTEIVNIFNDLLIQSSRREKSSNQARVATVLKSRFQELSEPLRVNVEKDFQRWFFNLFNSAIPNEAHELIAQTNYPYILTSNYDTLIEEAYKKLGLIPLAASFHESRIIAESIYQRSNLILHIHGSYTDVLSNKIIFTSEDYTQIIKKDYPGFSFAIQSLFLTHSVLFVGYGGKDPHMEDLIEEFSYWFGFHNGQESSQNYLVTKNANVNIIMEKYKERVRTNLVTIDDYPDCDILLRYLKNACPRNTSV